MHTHLKDVYVTYGCVYDTGAARGNQHRQVCTGTIIHTADVHNQDTMTDTYVQDVDIIYRQVYDTDDVDMMWCIGGADSLRHQIGC